MLLTLVVYMKPFLIENCIRMKSNCTSSHVIKEAVKCMRHSKRNLLTTEDVDSALRLRNVEVISILSISTFMGIWRN